MKGELWTQRDILAVTWDEGLVPLISPAGTKEDLPEVGSFPSSAMSWIKKLSMVFTIEESQALSQSISRKASNVYKPQQ